LTGKVPEEDGVPTVLIVDDSLVDQRLAGGLLERQLGCRVRYAGDGKEALEQMAAQLPDLVVTDLQMPHMNGLELVAAVRKTYPFVPVVLMTAVGSEEIAAQALREGAASYVPKHRRSMDLSTTAQRILLGALDDRTQSHLMHYLEAGELTFVVGNDWALLKGLAHHLQQMLRCLALADEAERLRVGVAVEEALTNAYYHGSLEVGASGKVDRDVYDQVAEQRLAEPPYRDRQIRVTAQITREEVKFIVRDQGPGFAVAQLPPAGAPLDAEQGAGRGLTLMRAIMDEVLYNDLGNEVTLVKRRAAQPALESEAAAE
jgi:CheY-like chemotaxis protein